jgi:hypothetical protein
MTRKVNKILINKMLMYEIKKESFNKKKLKTKQIAIKK